MDENALREEELSGVSGGAVERSFAAVAGDFAWTNRCDACPMGRLGLRHGICEEEYSRLLMEWSGSGPVAMRCKRRT